jgi:hypothetical protein
MPASQGKSSAAVATAAVITEAVRKAKGGNPIWRAKHSKCVGEDKGNPAETGFCELVKPATAVIVERSPSTYQEASERTGCGGLFGDCGVEVG